MNRRTEDLSDLLDLAIADAGRANANTAARAIDKGAHALEVEIPAPFGNVMCVADPAAELGAAPADFANLCHKTEFSRAVRNPKYSKTRRQPCKRRNPNQHGSTRINPEAGLAA